MCGRYYVDDETARENYQNSRRKGEESSSCKCTGERHSSYRYCSNFNSIRAWWHQLQSAEIGFARYQSEDRFVILTTEANASMSPVHNRMPLILEPEKITTWIFEKEKTEQLLHKTPCLLERRSEFEQLTLF